MAVTKVKRIRGNPGNPLSYIGNPEKTRNLDFSASDRQALADVIAYAADEGKTEKQYFTTGINCDVENAREQFNITKQGFNKTGGIVCGHCMQSFDGYEVTPEKAGMPTRYNVARQALDEAISVSANMEEFKSELKKRGYLYQFNPRRKYWTVTPPGWTKAIRTDRLGDTYTREMIQQRVFSNDIGVRMQRLQKGPRNSNHYDLKRRIDKIKGRSGLEKLYLRYCYELGYLPKYRQNPMRLHAVLKEEQKANPDLAKMANDPPSEPSLR